MIDPVRIKEPVKSHICFHMPSILPLETLLLIWPPLMILHKYFSYLLMILTLPMPLRNMIIIVTVRKEDNALGNMTKKSYKNMIFIAPHALIKTRNFINIMGFPWLIQRRWISSCNTNILWNKDSVYWCVCIPYTL